MTAAHIVVGNDTTTVTATLLSGDRESLVLPCGVSTLGQRHIAGNPPAPEELTNAIGEMMDHVDDLKRELPAVLDATSVTIAGAIPRTMATIEVGAPVTAAEFVLDRDAAEDVFRTMATESEADRRHNPGLPPELVSAIVGGCCVVIGLIRGLQLDGVTVMMNELP